MDPVLQSYLRATTAVEEQRQISQLLSGQVAPIASAIINDSLGYAYTQASRAFTSNDFDSAAAEVTWRILSRLRDRKALPAHNILNFRDLVARITHRVCSDTLRAEFPASYALECKLRYFIGRRPDWAIWEDENGEFLGGLESWKGAKPGQPAPPPGPLDPAREAGALTPGALERFVAETFVQMDRPLRLSDLTRAAVSRWQVIEEPRPPEPAPVPFSADGQKYLTRLWREILELPVRQRRALLLHIRDERGSSMLDIFAAEGVTDFEGIGAALDLSWSRILETWNALPLEDAAIARLLACSREEAAGLRRIARERLSLAMRQQ